MVRCLTVAAFVSLACGTAAFANTTDELEIISGATTIVIADNGPGDADGGIDDQIIFSKVDINGWKVSGTLGITSSPDGDPELDLSSLAATCGGAQTLTCSTDSITVLYSDINFNTIATRFTNQYSGTINGSGGSTTQRVYFDTNNIIFSMANPIGAVGSFTSTFDGFVDSEERAGPSHYSLTLEQTFSPSGDAITFSVDGSVSAVPEPLSVTLFGTLLFGLAAAGRYRMRRNKS